MIQGLLIFVEGKGVGGDVRIKMIQPHPEDYT
jgi:hypothetical protein